VYADAATGPDVNLFADGFFQDPYPRYETLREENSVFKDDRGVFFCFAYDDVRKVLIDPHHTSMDRQRTLTRLGRTGQREPPTFPLGLINRDPPDHARIRRLLSPMFTSRSVGQFIDGMERHVDGLLDEIERVAHDVNGPVDLMAGLAFPFPFRVISELLGMPHSEDRLVKSWAHSISLASDPTVQRASVAQAVTAYQAISEYITAEVLPWKRKNRKDDLLTWLVAAEEEGSLSADELVDNVGLLYVAGHETTSGLIGNGILNLLLHPIQFERLQADRGLLGNAIEELNRFDSSVQFGWRYVIDDFVLGDFVVPAGSMIFACCGSANRDPRHFGESADQLDLRRAQAKDTLSFGAGMHACLGAHLGRREAALVIRKLMDRYPNMALAEEPRWGCRVTFRSLERLPVVIT
jgi:cytochrome P450